MGVYTTDQYIKKMDRNFLKLVDARPHLEIISEVVRRQQSRVFDRGLDGKNKLLRPYSTKPVYVSIKTSPRKTTGKGSTGKSKFKNGKLHTSTFFSGGYAQFKKTVGKGGGGRVNLWLFGHFRTAFINSPKNPYKAVTSSKIQIKTVISPSAHNPQGKLDGIFDEFPYIFDLTKGEKKYILDRVSKLLFSVMSA